MPVDTQTTVTALFAAQAARTPDAVAVEYGERSLTYAELDRRAGGVAATLHAAGVAKGACVGVLAVPGIELIAGLLGVLRSGAAYVPLDPAHPRERLTQLVGDADLAAVLSGPEHRALLPGISVPVLELAAGEGPSSEQEPASAPGPGDLAYIIYTSGSTGRPKGVEVNHSGVAHLLRAVGDVYRLTPGDVGVLTHSFTFDASVLEIFAPLAHGARLVIATTEERRDPTALAALIARHCVTFWDVVPAMLAQVLELPGAADALAPLRLVISGADTLPPELVGRFFTVLPGAELHNQYGPTEATVIATYWQCSPADVQGIVPIGRPVDGVRVHLLDAEGRPVADGATGEIHIGGTGVSRGYRAQPGLTSERFVPDPFADDPDARLYRTGDLGRIRPDGALEFHGRADRQLSIRGYRVEPDEIETALLAHPHVQAAAVSARPGATGAERLIAWVVAKPGHGVAVGALRRHLSNALPPYMMPTHFVLLDRLPLGTTGKTDYRALPEPANARPDLGDVAYAEPAPGLESTLADIWSEILNIAPVGAHDNFFELGGHSILATRTIARIREALGTEVPLVTIFDLPTVSGLAVWIDERSSSDAEDGDRGPVPADRSGGIPLSAPQEQVWILGKLLPGSIAYHTQAYLDVAGHVDHALLEEALTRIVARHEHLRTAFVEVDGQPRQVVQKPFRMTVPFVDLSGDPEDIRELLALERMERFVARRIDVAAPPLFRWVLFRLAPDHHLLLLIEHHFIHDGWSFGVLLGELREAYGALVKGEAPDLPELPVQFADYTIWQREWLRGDAAREQLEFWRRTLDGAPALLPLPTDRPRPKQQSPHGETIQVNLPAAVYDGMRKVGAATGSTGFMTMLSAFFTLMGHWSGTTDISVASSIANRRFRATEPLIGMMINNVVMRADLSGEPTFRDLLRQVSKVAVDAYRNQDLPFPKLVEALNPVRDLSYNPLYQVAFSYHDARVPHMRLGEGEAEIKYLQNRTAKHDLDVVLIPRGDQLVAESGGATDDDVLMEWSYSTDLFDRPTVMRMIQDYIAIAEQVVRDPDAPISALARSVAVETSI
ncbi:amino acid adenylation domain-containing protein [Streptomyces sp. NBC_00400]|uniref:amino acid adenylation domain-containing protein n=1 Tax=Streptomyces sp. NBC_00400 TaxID=2975737 RepID=UPI002E1EA0E3